MPDDVGQIRFEDFADVAGEIQCPDLIDAADKISASLNTMCHPAAGLPANVRVL
jgi:hypothetical protein